LNIRFGHCTSCLFDNSSVKLCKHDTPFHSCRKARMMSRVWGWTAFAKRSAAMKAPVGLLSGSAVCDSRWRGVAPTSATPTRSLRKCRRIAEVKSQWSTTFSRIENLWPRDGSCPLPLRSKSFPGNCFRIVKAQKISRGGAAHVRESPFAPNEVPASVCAAALSGSLTEGVRSWHGITFRRLMQDSRYNMKKAERSADTTFCFFQAQE